jgi:RNA methyltransferase, TrmH family
VLADSNARLAAARRLTDRRTRRETGRFLAEGSPVVSEALSRQGSVVEVFGTTSALRRHAKLLATSDVPVHEISAKAAGSLSETASPQGLVAVCRAVHIPLDRAFARGPRLVVVLVDANDPGNAGTIVRTADAAGGDVVVFAGRSVDAYNGKAVRASAGSLFHLDLVVDVEPAAAIAAGRAAGLAVFAAAGSGIDDLEDLADSGALRAPTAWLFGNEANGLPAGVTAAADRSVHVPIHGRAESLNLAAAAAVCLYASARAHRER